MPTLVDCSCKRNKIELENYNFQEDLRQRMLMSELTVQDINLIDELISGPSTFPISYLLEQLELSFSELEESLAKIQETRLFTLEDSLLHINKEVRSYYDSQIDKFSSDFKPGIPFLRQILKKVPIQNLPNWYQIPRTSDNIFDSILESSFLTPSRYRRYLKELQFSNPVIEALIERVMTSPGLTVLSENLLEEFDLSKEDLSLILLHLEFNLVLCVSYQEIDGRWKEIVTPFHEWKEYLLWKEKRKPFFFPDHEVIPDRSSPFMFVQLMSSLLKAFQKIEIPFQEGAADLEKTTQALLNLEGFYLENDLNLAVNKLLQLNLATVKNGHLLPYKHVEEWLSLSPKDQAILLYRHPLNQLLNSDLNLSLINEKNIKEVEKSVTLLPQNEWFEFEAFKQFALPKFCDTGGVQLKKIGGCWKYDFPQYESKHFLLMEEILLERLVLSGFIETGSLDGKQLIKMTPLGSRILKH